MNKYLKLIFILTLGLFTFQSCDEDSSVVGACNEEDPSQVYGYIVGGALDGIALLHFIYVKHTFRNMGVGKTLLDAMGHDKEKAGVYTHHPRMADKLASKYNFVYHPYLMFDTNEVANGKD